MSTRCSATRCSTMGVKEAAQRVAAATGLSRRDALSAGARAEERELTMMRARDRRAAYRHGHVAEAAAALLLLAKGFRPIARRYKTPLGEIDLIVKRGRLIAFVEVKARALARDALESVGRVAERRIVDAADLWLAKHPAAAGFDLRYDMVVVTPWRLPHASRRRLPPGLQQGRADCALGVARTANAHAEADRGCHDAQRRGPDGPHLEASTSPAIPPSR